MSGPRTGPRSGASVLPAEMRFATEARQEWDLGRSLGHGPRSGRGRDPYASSSMQRPTAVM